MKKTIIQLLSFLILFTNMSLAALPYQLEKIQEIPSGKKLLESVEANGPLQVQIANDNCFPFEAMWNASNRTITINLTLSRSPLSSFIFELHNASTTDELEHYYTLAESGSISKEAFVEAIERMEHQNSLAAARVVDEGIALGIIHPSKRWRVIQDFDSHYKIQQLYGHSQWLASRYDECNPAGKKQIYRGTIQNNRYSDVDCAEITYYILLQDGIKNNGQLREEYLDKLHQEYNEIVACSPASKRKESHFEYVFGDDLKRDPLQYGQAYTIETPVD